MIRAVKLETIRIGIFQLMISNTSISSSYQVQNPSIKYAQVQSETIANNNSTSVSKTDSVSISNQAKELASIERDIASRYDVTNLSENERIAMSQELFANKLITPTQHAVMSFPIEEAASNMPGYEGSYNPDKKINYLQQQIAQLSFARNGGASSQELQSREGVISLLEDFNKYRTD